MVDFGGLFDFERIADAMSSDKMVKIASLFISFSAVWMWTMITVFAIGGTLGWIVFFLGFVVYFLVRRRKHKKAEEMRGDLVRAKDKGRNVIFDLKVIDGFVVIDLGDIRLAADGTDEQSMRILIRDLFNVIRTVRQTGTVMDDTLESEMMAKYFCSLGIDTSVARTRVRKDVLSALNNLYDMGYLGESVLDPELVNAVQSQTDSMYDYSYDGNAVKRILRDVEEEAVKQLHLDSPDVVVENK